MNRPVPEAPKPPQPSGTTNTAAPSLHCSNAPAASTPPAIPDHELIRVIGRGSYGDVWLARNKLGTLRAIKIVYRATFEDARPFEREFKGIQKFEPISRLHEGLVDILQVGGTDEYFYYVMELADAAQNPNAEIRNPKEVRSPNAETATAAQELRASDFGFPSSFVIRHSSFYTPRTLRHDLKQRGRLPIEQCVQIGQSLAAALAHLHAQGLVHRDVKPSNIIFVNGVPKLADIGLVADVSEARSFVGTEGFIPPEGPGAAQADLYSLGKVLYEISTGQDRRDFPCLPDDLAEDELVLELNTVILKACKTEPKERYRSAVEMQADFALLQRGKSVKRRRVSDRRRLMAQRVCFVMAVLAVVAVTGWLLLTSFVLSLNRKEVAQHADSLAMTGTKNQEAYELYVKAKVCLRRFTIEGEKLGRQYLEEAVKLDPNFLAAYELLFESYGESWLEEANAGMRATAKKLMELNPDSAPAQWANAAVKVNLDLQFAEAEQGFRRALQIDPNNVRAHVVYGWYLAMIGRTSAALEQLHNSANLDPGFPIIEQVLGDSYCVDRSYTQALAFYNKALALAPNFLAGHERAGRAYEATGDYMKAIDHFQKFDVIMSESGENGASDAEIAKISRKYDALREAFKQSGARGYWQKRLDQIRYPEKNPFEVAAILAQLGQTEKALQWLAAAYDKHDGMNYLLFEHRLDSLHHERGFQELLKKLGYPESTY